jgi:hypothetical protein
MKRAAASTGISRTRMIAAGSNNSVNRLPGRAHGTTHPFDPVGLAVDPPHPRGDEAVVLEEVEMLPSEDGESRAPCTPARTQGRQTRHRDRDHLEMQFAGRQVSMAHSSQDRAQTHPLLPSPLPMLQQPQRAGVQLTPKSTWNVEEDIFLNQPPLLAQRVAAKEMKK